MIKIKRWKKSTPHDATGFFSAMPAPRYHDHPALSRSQAAQLLKSPAHYQAYLRREADRSTTRPMEIGTALHTALLEPSRFEREYIDSRADKRTESTYKQAVSAADGRGDLVLTASEYAYVEGARQAVYEQPEAAAILGRTGWRELTAVARTPEDEVLVRARYDIVTSHGLIVDVKKTQDASEEGFSKSAGNFRYHFQAAWYTRVYEWLTGEPPAGYAIIAVEEKPPHYTRVYVFDDEAIAAGNDLVDAAIDLYRVCSEADIWPLPPAEPAVLALKPWHEQADRDSVATMRRLTDQLSTIDYRRGAEEGD